MGYYTIENLKKLGITIIGYGNNIKISLFVNIYNPSNLILHDNIRIDDFTIIACNGKIEIFNYVHISAQCYISSSTNIIIGNYTAISVGVKIFGGSDDYSGLFMTNPTIPVKYLNVKKGDIIFENHVIIGSNSVILPDIILKEGTAVGCNSMINKSTESWKIYVGTPIKFLKNRDKNILKLQIQFEKEIDQ